MTVPTSADSTLVSLSPLTAACAETLVAVGMRPVDADLTAETFVRSEAEGAFGHGLIRLPVLVDRIKAGSVDPRARLEVLSEGPAVLAADGRHGVGQVLAAQAMEHACAKAAACGIGLATVRNSSHFGRAGHSAVLATAHGFLGIAASNASPRVVPGPGVRPILGNNPWAVAAPASPTPVVVDMANSVVAAGRLRDHRAAGKPIPHGWATDAQGRPTTDPAAGLAGSLLAFGGHKGWGLSLIVDLLTGVLSGGAFGAAVSAVDDMNRRQRSCHVLMAIDPGRFPRGAEGFGRAVTELAESIAGSGQGARVPGARSAELWARHRENGLPLRETSLSALRRARASAGLPPITPNDLSVTPNDPSPRRPVTDGSRHMT